MATDKTTEAERMTVGALYIGQGEQMDSVIDILGIDGSKFTTEAYAEIYQAMVELHDANVTIDGGSLFTKIKDSDALREIPHLCESIQTSANATHYARTVLKQWQARQMLQISDSIKTMANQETNPDEIAAIIEQQVNKIMRGAEAELVGAEKGLAMAMERLEYLAQSDGGVTGVGTGIESIDKITHGFQDGNLVILAARPSVGKTAIALNVAHHAAIIQDRPVLFVSLEMGTAELWERLIGIAGEVDSGRIKSGFFVSSEMEKARATVEAVKDKRLYVIDQSHCTVHTLRSSIKSFSRMHPDGIVIIDYLQLISAAPGSKQQRYEVVGDQSRILKATAKEAKIPIMVLAQLGRGAEEESDGYKMMRHLRESGNIEQDADIVCILSRPDSEGVDNSAPSQPLDFVIAKHRNGPVATIPLVFDKQTQRFTDESGHFKAINSADEPKKQDFTGYDEDDQDFPF